MIPIIVDEQDPKRLTVCLSGRIDLDAVSKLWPQCLFAQKEKQPFTLVVDATGVEYCDGAGIALLLALKKNQKKAFHRFELVGLKKQFLRLFEWGEQEVKSAKEQKQEDFFTRVGRLTADGVESLKAGVTFLGEMTAYFGNVFKHPKLIRWKESGRIMEEVGPNALPIIILTGFLIGLISAFQAAIPLGRFGAQLYITDLVGISLVKELGPLMTAVILAGRTASAFAAEIGTMKINQEIDALTTMGLEPVQFLALPRVIATTLMTPILNLFLILFGLIGCYIVMGGLGFSLDIFFTQLVRALTISQVIGGSLKAAIFGLMIAIVGCYSGLQTRIGAQSVGQSTTRAVVSCIILMIIVDGIFAYIFYVLGI